jgi:hypothetical protein
LFSQKHQARLSVFSQTKNQETAQQFQICLNQTQLRITSAASNPATSLRCVAHKCHHLQQITPALGITFGQFGRTASGETEIPQRGPSVELQWKARRRLGECDWLSPSRRNAQKEFKINIANSNI